jgi:uncharacterized protein (DUF433 family)
MSLLSEYINIDHDIRFGKPCIRGTRITIGDIPGWLSEGTAVKEMQEDYPELTETHIRAALALERERTWPEQRCL